MANAWQFRMAGVVGTLAFLALSELMAVLCPGQWVGMPSAGLAWLALTAAAGYLLTEAIIQRSARRFGVLRDLVMHLGAPLDLQATLEHGLRRAMEITGADAGCVYLARRSGGFTLRCGIGLCDRFARTHAHVDSAGALNWMRRSGTSADATAGPMPAALRGMLGRTKTRAVVVVALPEDDPAGGLYCLAFRRSRRLLADDREALETIAAQMAIATRNAGRYERALREARTDPLTGVAGRREFEEQFRRELARARRQRSPLSLAVLDLDGFKAINDGWGHPVGDEVLKAFAAALGEVRATDLIARLGGDEFVVLMPDSSSEEAAAVISRLRSRIEALNASGRFPFPVRASIGVRTLSENGLDDLLAEADAAMYRSKQANRTTARDAIHDAIREAAPAASDKAGECGGGAGGDTGTAGEVAA